MTNLSRDQVNVILNNAPAGVDKASILDGLIERGYSLEGVDTNQARNSILERRKAAPIKENPFDNKIGKSGGLGGFITKGFNTLFGGGKLAQGAGQALAGKKPIESMSQALQQGQDLELKLIQEIRADKQAGIDTSRLEKALFEQQKSNVDAEKLIGAYTGSLKTGKEVFGSAARLAGSIAAPTIGGAVAGKVAPAAPGVLSGASRGFKIGAATGAIEGGLQGGAIATENNASAAGIAGGATIGALGGAVTGGILGGTIGAGTGYMKARQEGKNTLQALVKSNPTDARLAKYKVTQEGLVSDPVAKEAIKQGFDEGGVAVIKSANGKDKQVILNMLDDVEKGMTDRKYAMTNHPSQRIADGTLERIKGIEQLNKAAGKEVGAVAKTLKGQPVDIEYVVQDFIDDLADTGVTFKNGRPVFSNADFQGVTPSETLIKRITQRASKVDMNNAYEVHKLKQFIYDQLQSAKFEGTKGNVERIVTKFASTLDDELDNTFPVYNEANTKFRLTREVQNKVEELFSKKFSSASPNAQRTLATYLRRLDANTVSSGRLLDLLDELDKVNAAYGKSFNDDIFTQAVALQEIESVFPSAIRRNSFQGQITQGADKAMSLKNSGGLVELGIKTGAAAYEKAQGINQEGALAALRSLVKN